MACALALFAVAGSAPGAQVQPGAVTAELVGKAKALELRGRAQLARETWGQILQQEPGNIEALKGMIRSLQAGGRSSEAEPYVARLRAVHPDDPVLAQGSEQAANREPHRETQLREAERLAHDGKPAEALAIYRGLYGAAPPAGDVALHYYASQGATEEGRPEAIASLRALSDRFPQDARYRRALGSLLMLNARTQQEGQKLLGGKANSKLALALARAREPASSPSGLPSPMLRAEASSSPVPAPQTPEAKVAREPALVGQSRPAPLRLSPSAPSISAVTAQPSVAPLAGTVPPPAPPASAASSSTTAPSTAATKPPTTAATKPPTAIIAVPESLNSSVPAASAVAVHTSSANEVETRSGYAALNGGRLRDAELRFKVVLARDPEDSRALEGLGLLRLKQTAWSEALQLLENAEKRGAGDGALVRGLQRARASAPPLGSARAKSSLKGASPQTSAASAVAASTEARASNSAPVQTAVVRAPEALSLRSGTSASASLNRDESPQPAVTERAAGSVSQPATSKVETPVAPSPLAAPPAPAGETANRQDTKADLLRAASLVQDGQNAEAATLYRQVTAVQPNSEAAWTGLIIALARQGDEAAALKALDAMPSSLLQAQLASPEFATMVATVEQHQGRTGAARQGLEALLAAAPQPAGKAYGPAQLALATLLLDDGRSAEAYAWFRAAIASEFDNAGAWAGLLASLRASGHDREALAQIDAVPAPVRVQLEANELFLQTAALAYAGVNDSLHALRYWDRLQELEAGKHSRLPAAQSLEFAVWLGQVQDEARLYPALMALGGRLDLSDSQRRAVQRVWAAWALRQATGQFRTGDAERARLTLNAAVAAFSDNPEALRTLARGYAAISQPKTAVAMLRAQDLSNASAEDLAIAVTAALAAHDSKNAEAWLRIGLVRFRRDPDLLMLASRYEQETGHAQESAAYLQAALRMAPARAADARSGMSSARIDIATSEIPGSGSRVGSPNLAELLARGKALEKAADKGKPTPTVAGGRPFLPSFEQLPTSPAKPIAAR